MMPDENVPGEMPPVAARAMSSTRSEWNVYASSTRNVVKRHLAQLGELL